MSDTAITLYGIPNCDTVKKARTWLTEQGVAHTFHDFKKQGLDAATVQQWLEGADRDTLVNRKGTTWRGLPVDVKDGVTDDGAAVALMVAYPSVVKRPVAVLDGGKRIHVGFKADDYAALFA
ncbi:MAG TPA: arsenate reductase [Burkholderiaceae bacterium]